MDLVAADFRLNQFWDIVMMLLNHPQLFKAYNNKPSKYGWFIMVLLLITNISNNISN